MLVGFGDVICFEVDDKNRGVFTRIEAFCIGEVSCTVQCNFVNVSGLETV